VGYELYREIRDYAPAAWSSGMRLVALMIADDANDDTRRSWISNALLCQRTGLQPTGVKTALQRLAAAGYEMRVAHGTDTLGRPVYAVTGHSVDYLVPDSLALIGEATASPKPVDKPSTRRRSNVAYLADKGRQLHPEGEVTAPQGDAAASPLSSSPLSISSITNGPDLAGPVESSDRPPDQDHDSRLSASPRRHPTEIEKAAWAATIGTAR
jgi:hypothetical protein